MIFELNQKIVVLLVVLFLWGVFLIGPFCDLLGWLFIVLGVILFLGCFLWCIFYSCFCFQVVL